MSNDSVTPNIELGIYVHYKSDEMQYEVMGVARHTETDEHLVVYRPLYEHEGQPDIWVRPYAMFMSQVMINGVQRSRFTFLGKLKR